MSERKRFPTARGARRVLAIVGAPLLGLAMSVLALGGIASAHVVTSINADCYLVTVHFSQFPDAGVLVHIAADVTGQPTISTDVLVTSATSEANVDISAATAARFGATANVDVDVTWTYQGPHHAHETLTVTCGSPTTTTSTTTTSTTTTSTTTTTETPPTTAVVPTTITAPETTTSFTVMGSTTIVTTTTAPVATTTDTVGPQGSTAPATTTTVPVGSVTLPRTGSSPATPLLFGVSCLVAGALLLLRRGRAPSGEMWPR